MKGEYVAISVMCVILLVLPLSGCAGSSNTGLNASEVNITVTPQANPSPSASPQTEDYSPMVSVSFNKPSFVFNTDEVAWYEYILNYPRDNGTDHEKLVVDYEKFTGYDSSSFASSTKIQQILGYNGTFYGVSVSNDKMLSGSAYAGLRNGVRGLHSLGLMGKANLLHIRSLDISTRFDEVTDRNMKPVSNETVPYNGELYNCVVYEVSADNDTFRVWYNSSLPVPPKVVAYYEYPAYYLYPENRGNITGPVTYDLLEWGADRTAIPGWYSAPSPSDPWS